MLLLLVVKNKMNIWTKCILTLDTYPENAWYILSSISSQLGFSIDLKYMPFILTTKLNFQSKSNKMENSSTYMERRQQIFTNGLLNAFGDSDVAKRLHEFKGEYLIVPKKIHEFKGGRTDER